MKRSTGIGNSDGGPIGPNGISNWPAGLAAQLGPRRTLTGQPLPPALQAVAAAQAAGLLTAEHVKVLRDAVADLPGFVVLISQGSGNKTDQPIFSRLWGSGFLPSRHQGVRFRSQGDPVLYLSNPEGIDATNRRALLDGIRDLNAIAEHSVGDPEIQTRISQYEMAFRMQSSVPELMDLSREPKHVLDAYGPGTQARHTSGLMA